ncbi:hypothetical protein WA171_005701 [Blastocystis sp. BT1]
MTRSVVNMVILSFSTVTELKMFNNDYSIYDNELYNTMSPTISWDQFDSALTDIYFESNYNYSFESDSTYEEDRSPDNSYPVYQSLSRRNSGNVNLIFRMSLPDSMSPYEPSLDTLNRQLSLNSQKPDDSESKEIIPESEIITDQSSKEDNVVETKESQSNQSTDDSDAEWTLPADTDSGADMFTSSRASPKKWSAEECNRLQHAVSHLGASMHWNQVASYVGTRSVSQCINKWKNDICKGGKKPRWTVEATNRLREYINQGLSNKEIQRRMPEYTYIQIYQQTRKLNTNTAPWEEWEYDLLVKLKTTGLMGDTEIGRRLNNRHRDAVKNVWSHLKRERNLE